MRGKAVFARIAVVLLLAGCSQATAAPQATPSPPASPRTTLTAAEKVQLATLERRPLQIPGKPTGNCPVGPFTPVIKPYLNQRQATDVYGVGPVYGEGGPETGTNKNYFYDVTYFADPSVRGVVLVRIEELGGAYQGFFVGPYAAGKTVGTDVIDGQQVALFDELVLPIASPSPDTSAAAGWAIFKVRQGINKGYSCVGIQIDTASGTEVLIAEH